MSRRPGARKNGTVIPQPIAARQPVMLSKPKLPPVKVIAPECKPPLPAPTVPTERFLAPWEPGFVGGEKPTSVSLLDDNQMPTAEAYDFSYLSETRKKVFRLFAAEFIKDHNGAQAMLRLGYNYTNPHAAAGRWLKEPYVQYILDEYVRQSEIDCLVTRNSVVVGLVREANNYGPDATGASRVSAYAKLMKVLGMDVKKIEANVNVNGGVMLVPMLGQSAEQWQQTAAPTQKALKSGKVSDMVLDVDAITDEPDEDEEDDDA